MKVDTIFMGDRLGRGGDHTPFQWEGFAAVRISTPNEIYANQHHATDLLDNMSVPYTDEGGEGERGGGGEPGARAEAADRHARHPRHGRRTAGRRLPRSSAARRGAGRGAAGAGGRRPSPMIARGGGYDAVLHWRAAGPEADIKGYTIVMRPTTSPYWEQEIYVGKVNSTR